ncbi:MAG: Maf family protein [Hyphomicrobiaceae bacterium]|nr:Maf family protein [Hyphomicrobiaceae bacterium]
MTRLILASASPTRCQLLENAGLSFEIAPAHLDEIAFDSLFESEGRIAHAAALASAKARKVSQSNPDALVIGADQTLSLGNTLMHKAPNLRGARAQLQRLSGKSHILTSAVALARNGDIVWNTVDEAELTMTAFSDVECDQILALEGDAILGSVGCYRLEGPSIRLFKSVSGDYFTILGLPLLPLIAALRDFGALES